MAGEVVPSFISNVNTLASKLDIIVESNEIFNVGLIPVLEEIAQLDLYEAIYDLKKGNYLGNRKVDINLALNMQGITEDLISKDPDSAEAIWVNPANTVQYDKAIVTFVDGQVIELPFLFDDNPTTISTHADLLSQLTRLDYVYSQSQVDSVYQVTVGDNTPYTITIDNIPYTFTSGTLATREQIIAGLANLINTQAIPITATVTDNGTKVSLTVDIAGNPFYTEVSSNLAVATITPNVIEGPIETAFLAKLESTLISGFAAPVVGEFVRIYDVIGQNSNIERIQLHAVSGNYVEENPIYYWAKTTSAFQTLSMRANDIIKLGNEIDKIILLANSIEEVIEIQNRLPQLVDTYDVNGNPNGDETVFNNLTELVEVHSKLTEIIAIYNDIKVGGNNYIFRVGDDLDNVNSAIKEVATNLQTTNTVGLVGSSITGVNTVAGSITKVSTVSDNITKVNRVNDSIVAVDRVNTSINNLDRVHTSITNLDTVAVSIANVDTVATNIVAVQNAVTNANTAKAQAGIATTQAQIATNKANEIKNVSVGSTITGAAGTLASVVYNPTDGKFTFVAPQGVKGDRGEAFQVNAVGNFSERVLYDTRTKGFSFLAIDQGAIYFKLSGTSGDWSVAAPFGKGDKGDTGATGNGILQITFTSTTDISGLPSQSGATDTYTISYTDGTSDTVSFYNGRDGLQTVIDTTEHTVLASAASYTVNIDTTTGIFEVLLNGIRLSSTDYTLTGTSIVINYSVLVGDIVTVVKTNAVAVVDTYTQSAIDTMFTNERVNATTLFNKTIDSDTNFVAADQVHFKVKNMSGVTIPAYTLVKSIGYEVGEDTIRVAPVSSTSDVAIGITKVSINNGIVGLAVNTGTVNGINTSLLPINTILYSNGSGGFTSTKPTGNYQACAVVLKQHTNGALLVEFTSPNKDSAELIQTNTTNTKYVDSVTAVNYKMYVENGSIVMEEL